MYATPTIPCPLIHSAFKLLWEGAYICCTSFFFWDTLSISSFYSIS